MCAQGLPEKHTYLHYAEEKKNCSKKKVVKVTRRILFSHLDGIRAYVRSTDTIFSSLTVLFAGTNGLSLVCSFLGALSIAHRSSCHKGSPSPESILVAAAPSSVGCQRNSSTLRRSQPRYRLRFRMRAFQVCAKVNAIRRCRLFTLPC